MKEFMMLIRTEGDHFGALSPEQQQKHLELATTYIGGLVESGKLKSAQPLEMSGTIISGQGDNLKDGPFVETKEVIIGYFLLQAENIEEVVETAKRNPIFQDGRDVAIEVRPIMVMEGIND